MKEIPILMTGSMVRATLDDVKTQTRRTRGLNTINENPDNWNFMGFCGVDDLHAVFQSKEGRIEVIKCPYGKPGDRLWVRETWRVGAWRADGRFALDYKASPEIIQTPWCFPKGITTTKLMVQSEADCIKAGAEGDVESGFVWQCGYSPCRWRPSIHMYRWASRIVIENKNIRIERVQNISEEDARAEGVDWNLIENKIEGIGRCQQAFINLWDSINASRGYSWDSNPWVWVIEFKRIK